ncbi:hypothetical protein ACE1SV_39700 [Streptomyces sennicomposti]
MTIKRNPDGRPDRTGGGPGCTVRAPVRVRPPERPGARPGPAPAHGPGPSRRTDPDRPGVRTCGYADMGRWTRMDWSRPTATQTTNIDEPP